jgi:squalene synthase HpnC
VGRESRHAADLGTAALTSEKARSENFPVASAMLPGRVRTSLMAIYRYARLIDDLGDEAPGDRVALLDEAEQELLRVFSGTPSRLDFRALQKVVRAHEIPKDPFLRLIDANRQDQLRHRYQTFDELLAYCELSANPVGQLVLCVFDSVTPDRLLLSDRICSALQILEHLQDVGEDYQRGRIYLPQEDLLQFGCADADLAAPVARTPLRSLIAFETSRAACLLADGARLVRELHGFARLAVSGYLAGGYATVDALQRADYEVLGHSVRPSRSRTTVHWLRILANGGSDHLARTR